MIPVAGGNSDRCRVVRGFWRFGWTGHFRWSRGVLRGKAGDFLVQEFSADASVFPRDLWVVDADIFAATYTLNQSDRA
jgi:hypothetical protein